MRIQTPSPLKVEERCRDDGARPGVTAGTAKFPTIVPIKMTEQGKKTGKVGVEFEAVEKTRTTK